MKATMKRLGVLMAALGLTLGLGGKSSAAEPVVELPGWVKSLEIKGDLRLRYQYEEREEPASAGLDAGVPKKPRQRERLRLRLGFAEKISDTLNAGFGLATGSGDPRSTNQTLDNSFEKPDVRIDYAFLAYKKILPGGKELTLEGGKFALKDALWLPGDALWDTDITPAGGLAKIKKAGANWDVSLAIGLLTLDEISTTTRNKKDFKDPALYTAQVPLNYVLGEATKISFAATYYNFDNIYNHALLDHRANTNSTIDLDGSGPATVRGLKYDFDSVGLGLGVEMIPAGPFYVSLFGEYLKNPDIGKDIERELAENPGMTEHALYRKQDAAFLAGLKFGHGGLKKRGQWQTAYNYRGLGQDSWPDALPDSDAYGGGTAVRGHELVFSFAMGKGMVLGLDYYRMEKMTLSTEKERDHLLQVDLQGAF